ncbi:MAG: DUF3347 domain-containing protein [Fulvivirga sp.]
MKNSNLKSTSMVVAIILFAFATASNGQQKDDMDMKQPGNKAAAVNTEGEPAFLVNYMDIKNALVDDNYEQVKQAASDMQKSLKDSELGKKQRNQLKESVSILTDAQDIKAQRKQFAQLSQQLYQVVKNGDVTDNTLYWQHCPMALGEGANWLSYNEQVRNPFMGHRMPGCGSVEETIN